MSAEDLREYKLDPNYGLYDVLVTPTGKVIDGHHRLDCDPNWPKKVVPWATTEKLFWVARIQAHNHRDVRLDETASDLLKLRDEIEKEGVSGRAAVNELVKLSGFSDRYVRMILAKYDTGSGLLGTRSKPKETSPRVDAEEIEPGEEDEGERLPTTPVKGTEEHNRVVEESIQKYAGEPIPDLAARLMRLWDLTQDEAKMAITRFKVTMPAIWARIYDGNDNPRQPVRPTQQSLPPGADQVTFKRDEFYTESYLWYPASIADKVNEMGVPPSERRAIAKKIYQICWDLALDTMTEEEIFNQAIKGL